MCACDRNFTCPRCSESEQTDGDYERDRAEIIYGGRDGRVPTDESEADRG